MEATLKIPAELSTVLRSTPELREAYLVGGCVRDALLGIDQKDFDLEVFGLSYETLARVLSNWGRTDLVGRSFGVVKLSTRSGHVFDFSVPRRDSKVSPGHKGFTVEFDPGLGPRDAAARRDFTINTLMWSPRTGALLDFFGGAEDLRNRVLRHVGPAFVDDPLRVLRGMQFAGRFDLQAAPETVALSRSIRASHGELAVERVREEWFKWAGKSVRPSAGLKFLVASGWVKHYPEIAALVGCLQDPEWHPEGDVFVHTAHCCDAMAGLAEWQSADLETRIVLMLAILAHDFGKPSTTHEAERHGRRRIVSPGHEELGGGLARSFLERIDAPNVYRERVPPLVMNHLAHLQTLNARAVRRLARRLAPEIIDHLCVVIAADQFGRPPRPQVLSPAVISLREIARDLAVQAAAPKPILLGRHLIELGLRPGREFGSVLAAAFEAQLDGAFADLDGAYAWLADRSGIEFEFPDEIVEAARRRGTLVGGVEPKNECHSDASMKTKTRESVAVLGASRDRTKYGNKAVRAFQRQGYPVYPVNPKETEIEGLTCYASVAALPVRPGRVTVYLPPAVTLGLLPGIAARGCDELWLNPGSESPELVREAERLGLKVVQACSIVDIGLSPSSLD